MIRKLSQREKSALCKKDVELRARIELAISPLVLGSLVTHVLLPYVTTDCERITKSNAMREYYLNEQDLHSIRCISAQGSKMKLYYLHDVKHVVIQKFKDIYHTRSLAVILSKEGERRKQQLLWYTENRRNKLKHCLVAKNLKFWTTYAEELSNNEMKKKSVKAIIDRVEIVAFLVMHTQYDGILDMQPDEARPDYAWAESRALLEFIDDNWDDIEMRGIEKFVKPYPVSVRKLLSHAIEKYIPD